MALQVLPRSANHDLPHPALTCCAGHSSASHRNRQGKFLKLAAAFYGCGPMTRIALTCIDMHRISVENSKTPNIA